MTALNRSDRVVGVVPVSGAGYAKIEYTVTDGILCCLPIVAFVVIETTAADQNRFLTMSPMVAELIPSSDESEFAIQSPGGRVDVGSRIFKSRAEFERYLKDQRHEAAA